MYYLPRSTVPAPDTLHYTLEEYPSNLVWTQDRRPYHDLQLNVLIGRQISLSHDDKLEWITQEDSTIIVFLHLPDTGRAMSSQSKAAMLDTVQQPGHADVLGNWQSNPLPKQQQLHYHTLPLSRQGESLQKSQETTHYRRKFPPRRIKYSSEFQIRGPRRGESRPSLRRCPFPHLLTPSRTD